MTDRETIHFAHGRAALERIAASECALAWVCARDALDGAALAPRKEV